MNINIGKITILLPHPGAVSSALGGTPLTQCYSEAIASAVSKCRAQNHHKEKHKCGGWHARFKLQRHGLQVSRLKIDPRVSFGHFFRGILRLPRPRTISNHACILRIFQSTPLPPSTILKPVELWCFSQFIHHALSRLVAFGSEVTSIPGSIRYLFPEPHMLPEAPLWVRVKRGTRQKES